MIQRSTRSGRPRWAVAAAAVGGASITLAVVAVLAARGHDPKPVVAPAPTSTLAAKAPVAPSAPPRAPAPPKPPPVAPPPVAADAPGTLALAAPTPAPVPPEGTQPRRSPARPRPHAESAIKPPQAAPAPAESGGQCQITVGTFPWSELWIDGADTGQHTPVVAMPIACGRHRLQFKRRDLRVDQVESVTLDAGHDFRRQYELHGAGLDD
jgi:hypothetical protein